MQTNSESGVTIHHVQDQLRQIKSGENSAPKSDALPKCPEIRFGRRRRHCPLPSGTLVGEAVFVA